MPEIYFHTPEGEGIYGNFKSGLQKNVVGAKEEGNEKFVRMRSVDFGREKTNPRILKGTKGRKLGNQQLT